MSNPYAAFCEDFYVNMRLGSQLSLPHSRDTLLHLFERVQKTYPTMTRFRKSESGEFNLEVEAMTPIGNTMYVGGKFQYVQKGPNPGPGEKIQQSYLAGFDVNTGSNERVRETQTDVAQYDQNVIRWDAAKTSYGYETKATTDVAEANLDKMAASQSEEAGTLGMWGSFISGAGNVAGKWMQGKSAGAFG